MEITPYHKNAKKHPDKQLKLIALSLKKYGWQQPIKVGQDKVIIAGHGRYLAYKKYKEEFGIKDYWIIDENGKTISGEAEPKKLSIKEEKEYRLMDNKIAESEWDLDLRDEELKELAGMGTEIDELGFDKDLLIEPDEKDDEVPELPEEPTSQLGDIYQLGNHRIMCGDSTKIEDVEKLMDGKKADMVFTDPPYGVDYEGINNDDRAGLEELLRDAFANYTILSKIGASVYIFHSDRCADIFHKVFREYFHFSSMIIWEKPSLVLSQTDYQSKHEPILYGWIKNGTHQYYGDRKQTSIWKAEKETRIKGHTTPKPVEIISKALNNSSKGDDIIIDLFLGSGSTLIACEKTNRICFGMELDCRYIDVIIKRYEEFSGNKATLIE